MNTVSNADSAELRLRTLVLVGMVAVTAAMIGALGCSPQGDDSARRPTVRTIRITGSDTMVNLVQAWSETYATQHPEVSVQVAGGGSGVGIVALTERLADIAAASREMTADERVRAVHDGSAPVEFVVAFDALAVFVHRTNPLESIAIPDLADIYGEGGRITKWSQLGVTNPQCRRDVIVRISRQSSSGTSAYFRDVVLGSRRDYKLGSIDQSGSKDVVALITNTPCAIGYGGLAYATDAVKMLRISPLRGAEAIAPTGHTATTGAYPLVRPLFLYTLGRPQGEVQTFIDWVIGSEGQRIVSEIGFVPIVTAGA